ncbi:Mo-dependent nitrogenase family protein [Rippkaea orientalis PCC 8801]|uniref:Mo-dependent nitrogenase family protein n=1 Tax=Rippkaea orientalis (strain PCC 8801 / RF-1) TaxID=41431 RepID=B7JYT5_RIPO1|nr:Mo-dependent nitrogenase C-terminal domain-containing protein [Rippkaea orientalis]ACK66012.1 Mo-dependent nitrogenase family protein [Rippkaea orientalis PCC 8801]
MSVTDYTIKHFIIHSLAINPPSDHSLLPNFPSPLSLPDGLKPLRNWLNNQEIHNPTLAHRLCRLIPAQCPFARDVNLFGRVILSIPPLCKINPLYEELMFLRFRALCYLAEEMGEDISQYC